ncbi:hypothetical protein EV44_g3148 [Erysiphe necator]|uniref:Uncharacterized protein n=1 Tax=Uncinula necator TaxID=52586 RepID=A0A0B1PCN5_UNCNE|nr:hypothetical protein EV44_g3148 [Erysiphe necator]
MSTGSISLSSKDFSASCLPNTVVISGTKMSRAKRQKRQRLSSKKRRARKRDIEFWHRAIERPDTKPVDRLVAHLSHIEHRSWKEVQEIVVQRTGIFNKIPAMQMKMTRLKEKAEAEFASSSSVLSVSIGEEFPLKEAQWPFENGTIQEANSDGYVWQPNLLENRTSWNWGAINQPFCQELFSSWTCESNAMYEQNLAWNSLIVPQVEWATSGKMLSKELWTQPDSSCTYYMPGISCSLQTGSISGLEWGYESQSRKYPPEYDRYTRLSCPDIEADVSMNLRS